MKVLVLNPASSSFPNVVRDQIFGCWYKGKEIGGMQMPPLAGAGIKAMLSQLPDKAIDEILNRTERREREEKDCAPCPGRGRARRCTGGLWLERE